MAKPAATESSKMLKQTANRYQNLPTIQANMDNMTSVVLPDRARLEAPANVCQKSKISQVQKMVNLKP